MVVQAPNITKEDDAIEDFESREFASKFYNESIY